MRLIKQWISPYIYELLTVDRKHYELLLKIIFRYLAKLVSNEFGQ